METTLSITNNILVHQKEMDTQISEISVVVANDSHIGYVQTILDNVVSILYDANQANLIGINVDSESIAC